MEKAQVRWKDCVIWRMVRPQSIPLDSVAAARRFGSGVLGKTSTAVCRVSSTRIGSRKVEIGANKDGR